MLKTFIFFGKAPKKENRGMTWGFQPTLMPYESNYFI